VGGVTGEGVVPASFRAEFVPLFGDAVSIGGLAGIREEGALVGGLLGLLDGIKVVLQMGQYFPLPLSSSHFGQYIFWSKLIDESGTFGSSP